MTRRRLRAARIAALAAASLSAGCIVRAAPGRVPVELPAQHRGAETAVARPTSTSGAAAFGDLAWWQVFSDPVLVRLVHEAIQKNDDLDVAAARILEARALVGVERSALFPQVDAQASARRSRSSGAAFFGPSLTTNTFSASLPVAWEIDLFGRIHWSKEAANARWARTIEDRNDLLRLLIADVAQAYVELRALDEDRAIALDTVRTRGGTRDLFAKRLEGGEGSRIEVSRSTAELAFAQQAVPIAERSIAQKENQIAILLGRNPGPIERGSAEAAVVQPERPADLPSALLRRRPDVRSAEAAICEAAAGVGIARADLYPRLSITGLLGLESADLADLTTDGARTWSLGGSLLGPLFDGGARRGRLNAAQARWQQARADYERIVRTALREVADALVATVKLREAVAHAQVRVTALEDAAGLAIQRYEGQASSYFEVLDAQRELFPARLELVRLRREQRVAVVQLYRALGGGWDTAGCAPGAPKATSAP